MSKKLVRNYLLVLIVTFIVFVTGIVLIIDSTTLQLSKNNALNYLNIVENRYEENNYDATQTIADFSPQASFLRITIIDAAGNVIIDSSSTTNENHLNRIEIQNPGVVYKRYSATLDMSMLYVAHYLENQQMYVRISIPLASIQSSHTYSILLTILLAITLVVLSYFAFQKFVKHFSQALNKVSNSLGLIIAGNYHHLDAHSGYPEIDHILHRINDVNQQIANTVHYLAEEKNKINDILNNINQGIVAIDQDRKIMLINQYIKQIFRIENISVGNNFLLLIRKIDLQNAILDCLVHQTSGDIQIDLDNQYYKVIITPLTTSSSTQTGVLVLMRDVTESIKSDTMKKEFFANASHELKSPLTSIIGAAELISNQLVTKQEDIIDLSHRIYEEASRMKELVLQMLSITRLENLKQAENTSLIHLKQLAISILDSLDHQAKDKQIKIHLTCEDITMKANYDDLYQMVSNLVENAIRYGYENGNVWINIYQNPGPTIAVKDDGIGIDKIHHERIFERFYRVDKGRNRDSGSTGLGLAIVKHVALIYDGKISLHSELGKGTEIKISFPPTK